MSGRFILTGVLSGLAGMAVGFGLAGGGTEAAQPVQDGGAGLKQAAAGGDDGGRAIPCDCPTCPLPDVAAANDATLPVSASKRRSAVDPRDHALRWPKEVPERFRPAFVRAVIAKAKEECEGVLPSPLLVDCKSFPCAIIGTSERGDGRELSAEQCAALGPLGELSHTSRTDGRSKTRTTLVRQSVGSNAPELQRYERRSEALRRRLIRGDDAQRLKCELTDDAEACAAWATGLAADDLDAATGLARLACEDGAGRGCALLAALGDAPLENYAKACDAGDSKGCVGAVAELCGRDGETCSDAALKHAEASLKRMESDPKVYEWHKAKARQLVGKVLCARGETEQGIALLTEGCMGADGNLRSWCKPEFMCSKPRFSPPQLW